MSVFVPCVSMLITAAEDIRDARQRLARERDPKIIEAMVNELPGLSRELSLLSSDVARMRVRAA